ncbi:hypothetical protein SAMN02745163_03716 [Clostridium cavendishii DSM 21758]|uniref:Uncharacterized protein n=1 Tax=Clostridium cavendishii DSM 21758 TaxID=1121302 RepID=A0A1M6S0B1_9CLOT|nr:histidine kinase [Clostridium cavendishii]SHK38080.1 hypothetical protein SAMN02745163_03716 [Clostridium cavendishii DSM 21758]
MELKLFSIKDLSIRWRKDEGTVRRYVRDGILTPCKGVPGMMFHPRYIEQLEGVELERFSPIEKKRLEKELEELKMQNANLRKVLGNILVESSKIINLVGKN